MTGFRAAYILCSMPFPNNTESGWNQVKKKPQKKSAKLSTKDWMRSKVTETNRRGFDRLSISVLCNENWRRPVFSFLRYRFGVWLSLKFGYFLVSFSSRRFPVPRSFPLVRFSVCVCVCVERLGWLGRLAFEPGGA